MVNLSETDNAYQELSNRHQKYLDDLKKKENKRGINMFAKAKSRMDLNMRNLEEIIGRCDFRGTASAFSQTTRELIESYGEMKINSDEYNRYMNKAVKMLDDSKCNCTNIK